MGAGVHSFSSVSMYERCPKAYSWSYGHVPPPGEPRVETQGNRGGSAVHAAFEAVFRSVVWTEYSGPLSAFRPEAASALTAAWNHYELHDSAGNYDDSLGLIYETLDDLGMVDWRWIVAVEHKFFTETPAGSRFIGFADLILGRMLKTDLPEIEGHSLTIWDWKIGRYPYTAEELQVDFQVNLYGAFARREFPEFDRVFAVHYQPPVRSLVRVELTADTMDEALERFDADVEMIETDEEWKARPNDGCRRCRHSAYCPAMGEVVALGMLDI